MRGGRITVPAGRGTRGRLPRSTSTLMASSLVCCAAAARSAGVVWNCSWRETSGRSCATPGSEVSERAASMPKAAAVLAERVTVLFIASACSRKTPDRARGKTPGLGDMVGWAI